MKYESLTDDVRVKLDPKIETAATRAAEVFSMFGFEWHGVGVPDINDIRETIQTLVAVNWRDWKKTRGDFRARTGRLEVHLERSDHDDNCPDVTILFQLATLP